MAKNIYVGNLVWSCNQDDLYALFAAHGLLSLFAFLWFVILGVFAYQEQRLERWYFRDRPTLTWTFLAVWMVSILSGELLFVLRYLV